MTIKGTIGQRAGAWRRHHAARLHWGAQVLVLGYRAGAGTAPYTWCAMGSPAPFTPCLVRAVYLTVRNFASTHPSAAPVFTRLHPFTTSPTWRR